jgi:prepilin-type N-terminal cleavage/methylation domain-containing protein
LASIGGVRNKSRCSAFTLLEILLVLAIIGLISGVLVVGVTSLLNDKPVSAEEIFWKAVQEARKTALKSEHEVTLRFSDEERVRKFVVSDGQTTKEFPVQVKGDLDVSFLIPQAGGNLIVIAGAAVETQKVPAVIFYPDGTCTAFRAQFFRSGTPNLVAIDPWTCAPVLTPADANKR